MPNLGALNMYARTELQIYTGDVKEQNKRAKKDTEIKRENERIMMI
jgi:hypothetical protein